MKTTAILNQKGGVGKTTLAFHLGWFLAERGKSVLLIDLDPQGTLSGLLGLDACDAQSIFAGGQGGAPELRWRDVNIASKSGPIKVSVVTADERLQAFEAVAATHQNARNLRRALQSGPKAWDHVVIDCPPSLGGFAVNAVLSADFLLVPSTVRTFSVAGLARVLEFAESARTDGLNPGIQFLGIVLNQHNPTSRRQTNFEAAIAGDLDQAYDGKVLGSAPSSIKVEEALYSRLPVWEYARVRADARDTSASASAEAYLKLMENIATRLNGGTA